MPNAGAISGARLRAPRSGKVPVRNITSDPGNSDDSVYSSIRSLDDWAALLTKRRRSHGRLGVEQIWRAMQTRTVNLPVGGPAFDNFWSTFLKAFLDDPTLLKELIAHASQLKQNSGRTFHFLYKQIMDYYMIKHPATARELFEFLCDRDLVPPSRAQPFIRHVLASKGNRHAVRLFEQIYLSGQERNLYDHFISAMKEMQVSTSTMRKWHGFLILQGDFPSPEVRSTPEVEHLFTYEYIANKGDVRALRAQEDRWLEQKTNVGDPFDPEAPFTRERLSSVIGEIHGIKQKSVTDAFCARLFATGGISTGFMIGALAMFGLDTVGPLALRELAARGETVGKFREALRELRERKIAITDCAFSRALRKFANDGREDLFESIVISDRHPDTYEQRDILERLVEDDLMQDRTTDAHALLAILVMSDRDEHNAQWNSLLKAEARNRRRDKVRAIVQEMLLQGQKIRSEVIYSLMEHLLPARSAGSNPQTETDQLPQEMEATRYVAELFLAILNTGRMLPIWAWRELMKRYGMVGRIDELSYLSYKLAEHHLRRITQLSASPRLFTRSARLSFRFKQDQLQNRLKDIFDFRMQRAIVAWGFQGSHNYQWLPRRSRDLSLSQEEQRDSRWLEGIKLLAQLLKMGVHINSDVVRRETVSRLGMTYTPGVSAANPNRALKDQNQQALQTKVDLIQEAWGNNGLFKMSGSIEEASEDERERLLYQHLFKDSGWLRRSQLSLVKKWKKKQHFPQRHTRPVDLRAMKALHHALQSKRQEDG